MVKKRLIGVVTVKDGWAVQSFGYSRYLPLGRPEILVENLDRWGADEILLQCIDRSTASAGPDLALLDKVSRQGLSTPLIYAGGIRTAEQAVAVVKAGADRICIDALLHDDPAAAAALAEPLGAQAVIAALPLALTGEGPSARLEWLDYRTRQSRPLTETVLNLLQTGIVSEALLIDWKHEGQPGAFDFALLDRLPLQGVPRIVFGGLSDSEQWRRALTAPDTVAVAVGNFLSYREHAVRICKQQLTDLPLRPASHEPPSSA
ncbi:HisA/HisF-related TIM barrel protein [Polaromonas sp.]|uniref:HisA/HisF-related TIM barrel protein n=1 Tax=Polaromonas sp. TaxID=1869339 RepID=UPI003BACE391